MSYKTYFYIFIIARLICWSLETLQTVWMFWAAWTEVEQKVSTVPEIRVFTKSSNMSSSFSHMLASQGSSRSLPAITKTWLSMLLNCQLQLAL